MKQFGERFGKWESFGIEHISIPDIASRYKTEFLKSHKLNRESLPEIMPQSKPHAYGIRRGKPYALRVLRGTDIPTSMKKELKKVVVQVAPAAHVYRILPTQKGLAKSVRQTLHYFDYYVVELGLNVMLGSGFGIPELLFEVDLKCDGRDRTDVTAYSIAPDDTIKRIKVISGKISLGLTKLLELVPAPYGTILSNLLTIELNPWEFEWGFDRYQIDASGAKNYQVYWKIYETKVVQGFNPTMILKVRKGVGNISAHVGAIYKLSERWKITKQIRTDKKTVKIWP